MFCFSFFLVLDLGHRGDAPLYAVGLDLLAAGVTDRAQVLTPPARYELPPPPTLPVVFYFVLFVTNLRDVNLLFLSSMISLRVMRWRPGAQVYPREHVLS